MYNIATKVLSEKQANFISSLYDSNIYLWMIFSDGSTMLIEAAKGGHTTVVNLLLDYPQGLPKTLAAATEYQDNIIPMADDLPADSKDLTLRTTESLASKSHCVCVFNCSILMSLVSLHIYLVLFLIQTYSL